MKAFPLALACVTALTFSSHAGELDVQLKPMGELTVQPNEENVVASRLVGTWELDTELSKRLISDEKLLRAEELGIGNVSFQSQPEIVLELPEKYEEPLADKQIYMAGLMSSGGKEFPFILVEINGNPHVVYFRERDGDPMGDAESFNVMLAPASDRENDILLLGDDFNNQPFMALKRQRDSEKLELR